MNLELIYAAATLCHTGLFAAMIGRVSFPARLQTVCVFTAIET